jgi:hypothetical protein
MHFHTYKTWNCSAMELENRAVATLSPAMGLYTIIRNLARRAGRLLQDDELLSQLQHAAPRTDLMVTDFYAYAPLWAIKLGLPHVDFDVGTAGSLLETLAYDAHATPAYIPALGTYWPTNGMGFLHRAANIAITSAARNLGYYLYLSPYSWLVKMVKQHNIPLKLRPRPTQAPFSSW